MWFRRKNQIDISIEKNASLNADGEFTNLSDATKVKPKRKLSEKFKEFGNESKKTFKNSMTSTKEYFKKNKYFFYKSWLTFISVYIIAFTFTMALLPFSYFDIHTGVTTTLTNFYIYDGYDITLSAGGIAYIVSLFIVIEFWIGEMFMYKKHETYKITKEMRKASKTAKAFNIMKYLAWGCLFIGLIMMIVLILVPPSIGSFNEMFDNQNFVLNMKQYFPKKSSLVSENDINRLMSMFPSIEKLPGATNIDKISFFFQNTNDWRPSNTNNLLTFYTMYNGGVSELNTAGLVMMSIGSSFTIIGVICFIVKWMNNFFNTHSADISWLAKMNVAKTEANGNANVNVNDQLSNLNSKFKGAFASVQSKFKKGDKNRDSFKKYKKRLVEEGKDTNVDKFTTDVKGPEDNASKNEGFFSVLKAMRAEKKEAKKASENAAGKVSKNRMKPAKPEIAVPDDELEEIIDSLDIK